MLNPQSPIPLYRQLADTLAAGIRAGDYPPGVRIPSEPRLAADHHIGRPTVRQAIDVLVRKGLLKRRRGSGTYVCEPQQEVDLFSLDGTSVSFRKKGVSAVTRLLTPLRFIVAGGHPQNPFSKAKAYFLSRLTLVDDTPVLIEDLFLHPDIFKGLENFDMQGQSLSAIAEKHFYLRPTGAKQRFSIGYATDQRAEHLQVTSDTPLLVVQRFLHFPQAENAVFSELWCRSDQFSFSQTIGGAVYA
jgi:GntR family transcriptional regulator